jgi:ribonuclease P protein component
VVLLAETEHAAGRSTDAAGSAAPRNRLGLTVSRKVGNAVVRNQIKRRIREWFRRHRNEFPKGDLVVIARPSAGKVPPAVLRRDLRSAAAALGTTG